MCQSIVSIYRRRCCCKILLTAIAFDGTRTKNWWGELLSIDTHQNLLWYTMPTDGYSLSSIATPAALQRIMYWAKYTLWEYREETGGGHGGGVWWPTVLFCTRENMMSRFCKFETVVCCRNPQYRMCGQKLPSFGVLLYYCTVCVLRVFPLVDLSAHIIVLLCVGDICLQPGQ